MNAAIPPAAWALATACSATVVTGGLRAVDLDDPAPGQAADAQRHIQGDRAGRDDRDRLTHLVSEAHHRALAEVLVDLGHRQFECFFAIGRLRHDVSPVVRWFGDRFSVGWR